MSSLLYLLFVVYLWSNSVAAITCLLRPGDEECFFDESSIGDDVHGTFAVTHGEAPINMKIFDATDKIVLELPETMENAYTFKAMKSGSYTICFKSTGSELQTIEFNLHVGSDVTVKNVMKEDHLTLIDESVQSLKQGVNELSEQTKYHRNRLVRHQKTTESTGSRITWWSLTQGTILVSLALIQTWIIKNLFDKKRTV